jgi:hypothetical protein
MSTPSHTSARHPLVERPPSTGTPTGRDDRPDAEGDGGSAGEQAGVYQSHPWLVPVTVIGSIIGAFVAMVLLTLAAGGGTLFGG